MNDVQEIASGIFQIDLHFQGVPNVIAAFAIDAPDGITLIETGPSSTLASLLAGLDAAALDVSRLRRLIVTHIHLDHAGAAGTLMRRFPAAKLFVHPIGAPHMIDPARLLASATRIYGDAMDRLWGEFLPCPADRVVVLQDGDTVDAGGRVLRALYTPGHATHHHAIHDVTESLVFTGDVAGIRLPGAHYVRPPTPPPDINLDDWRASIARLRTLGARRLALTHFGVVEDVSTHLDETLAQLFSWAGWVEAELAEGTPREAIVARLHDRAGAELVRATGSQALAEAYEWASPSGMTVDGLERWLRKREILRLT